MLVDHGRGGDQAERVFGVVVVDVQEDHRLPIRSVTAEPERRIIGMFFVVELAKIHSVVIDVLRGIVW